MRRRLAVTAVALLCATAPVGHAGPGDLARSFFGDGKLGFNPC